MVYDPHILIVFCELVAYFRGPVLAPVINNDDLVVACDFRDDRNGAANGGSYGVFLIICRKKTERLKKLFDKIIIL
jgi:hypothetical protein